MSDSESQPEGVFDLDRIRQLVELMREYDLAEVDLAQDEQSIRLKRGAEPAAPQVIAPMGALPTQPLPTPGGENPAGRTPAEQAAEDPNITVIKSPMVGTFYCKANPDADPFVRVGDMVQPDTVICIVEAMKVFNEIPADVSGRVVEVLVENEEPVEFGKPLFKVDVAPAD